MKFIHAADIHLDSPLKGLDVYEGAPVDEIRGATRRALVRLVDLAIDEAVDFLLIAGDLYDGQWKDHNTGLFFVAQMARLREANIRVVVIRGNHDAESKMTETLLKSLPSNVSTLSSTECETIRLDDLGVVVHGRSFAQPKELTNLAEKYPAAINRALNIGLLHTALDGREHHDRYAPCNVDDLKFKGYGYWALGHVHTREDNLGGDDVPIHFAGNIQGRSIRECGAKGCLLVNVAGGDRPIVEFRSLDVLRWEHATVDCAAADHPDEVLALCRERFLDLVHGADGRPLAVRVTLVGATTVHGQLLADQLRWKNEIRATAIDAGVGKLWLEKIRFRTAPGGALDELAAGDGPLGELIAYLRELQHDKAKLAALAEYLAPLAKRLPSELMEEPEPLLLEDPSFLAAALAEVEPLLVSRLLAQEAHA